MSRSDKEPMNMAHKDTAHDSAQVGLESSEVYYQTLFELAPDGILFLSPDGIITSANASFLNLSGFKKKEIIGRRFTQTRLLRRKDIPVYANWFMSVLNGEKLPPLKLIFNRRNGSYGVHETRARVIERNDKVVGVIAISRDVTEQERALQEKQVLEEQLQQAQKMDAIGKIAGGVAHDMNNMLTGIMGFASIIRDEMVQHPQAVADAKEIIDLCKQGRELTTNLLGFARKGKYRKERVSINSSIRQVQSILAHTISKKITMRTILTDDLHDVEGDSTQLSQVLINLCLNAADAIDDDGMITVRTRNTTLNEDDISGIPYLRSGRFVELSVIDNGIGMPAHVLEHVFEPFFTTKPNGAGTGLGLSLVYGVVKHHGGAVLIDSTPFKGTSVTVLLPIADEEAPEKAESVSSHPPMVTRPGTVLLVDDEQAIRNSVARVLKRYGFEVMTAENGIRAVELFEQHWPRISCVILDIVMPVMDGEQTFNHIRRIQPDAAVLITSGYSAEEKAEKLLLDGASGFLQKPFEHNQLLDEIHHILEGDATSVETNVVQLVK